MEPEAKAEASPAESMHDAAATRVKTGVDSTEGGRYIPYSGGSAGWFENSGVLKSERRNNYRFRQVMDLPEVRAKQFLRWGEAADRRSGRRKQRKLPVRVVQKDATHELMSQDMSDRGVRLQFIEPVDFREGESCTVEVLNPGDDKVVASLDAQVIWAEEEGHKRKLYNVGLFFPHPSAEAMKALNALTAGK